MEGDGGHTLGVDLGDLNLGVGLTVTLSLAVTLLGGVLEDTDLLALTVLDDGSLNGGAGHSGGTDGGVVAIQNSQDLIELDLIASLAGQLLDEQGITLCHLVLLAAGNNDCVHSFCTSLSFIVRHLTASLYGRAVVGGA